jgi:putative PIG3 family NAD(P)H quinone oxidoreductase
MPATMRAIQIGNDENKSLSVVEVPVPAPKPGEVRIKIAYSGLNRADLLQRRGFYPPPAGASSVMGMEITGVIEAVGEGAKRWKEGDAVCTVMPGGGYAEYATVDWGAVLPIPAPLSLQDACAIPEAACTVWQCVFEMGALKPTEAVLMHGGASGVGVIGIQMAVAHGAKVFSTAGDDEKCALVTRLGARAINYKTEDFEAIVRAEGRVDVVLDMVGGEYVQKNFACLNQDGRCVQIAFLHGSKVTVDLMPIMLKRILFTGATLRGRNDAEKARLSAEVEKHVWPWIAAGKIKPVVDSVYALEDVEQAHARMAAGKHAGKLILKL